MLAYIKAYFALDVFSCEIKSLFKFVDSLSLFYITVETKTTQSIQPSVNFFYEVSILHTRKDSCWVCNYSNCCLDFPKAFPMIYQSRFVKESFRLGFTKCRLDLLFQVCKFQVGSYSYNMEKMIFEVSQLGYAHTSR